MILKHIPNILTITRILLIAPFLAYLCEYQYTNAFYLFMFAGFTDGLDGFLARYFRWQSVFGSFVDPLSDKLLIASSYIALACIGKLPLWLVVLVFSRDLSICFGVLFWCYYLRKPLNFKPTFLSKVNTVLQLALVTLCLFDLAFFEPNETLLYTLILLTGASTTCTYIDYAWTWGKKALLSSSLIHE
jgi:cardiolipin synthase